VLPIHPLAMTHFVKRLLPLSRPSRHENSPLAGLQGCALGATLLHSKDVGAAAYVYVIHGADDATGFGPIQCRSVQKHLCGL